jgi:hypothetical protein
VHAVAVLQIEISTGRLPEVGVDSKRAVCLVVRPRLSGVPTGSCEHFDDPLVAYGTVGYLFHGLILVVRKNRGWVVCVTWWGCANHKTPQVALMGGNPA